ncbi:Eco29kI family restriction endonuclease [Bremerella sp. P1]|uniref:Eco29kI family restriction endonuclease n=1 Tax=Bremerella sp. P1 TaxID=3026424 RepID=UPI003FCE9CC1
MREETPYNPLDKVHLGESVANAILRRPVEPLPPPEAFLGAGVYAIYYTGDFPAYRKISERNRENRFEWPIYVGKAIPAGARRGGFGLNVSPGRALFGRLNEHGQSVEQAGNIDRSDFFCRYLVVDDIWIPLGEALLIQMFSPVWNTTLDGYGNHDPGRGRYNQQRSPWDVVHPGREWAMRCAENARTSDSILEDIETAIIATF